ncbi:MAG: HDOD domain-containing protein [Planctomycetes bacterium]|nr:HDOD domain-containing protein [Planctomycetota bacterium]
MIENMEQILERVATLPRLPDASVRLVEVLNNPNSTIVEIVDTIRYDQAITAEVLRLCNSASMGLSRTVTSLDDAVAYLGTAKVLQLVMAAHTRTMLGRAQEGYGLPPGSLWAHSVAVALTGQTFARRLGLSERGVMFTAGLLHDVGKVVLNEYVASEYAEIARLVFSDGLTFLEAEQQVLGFTHPEIGGRIAERWDLPAPITRAIRYHHEPDELASPDSIVDAIHLADAICLLMGVGLGHDGLMYRACPNAMERHGLTEGDLETIGADVVVELKPIMRVFAAD